MKKVFILVCASMCLISCKKEGCTNPWAVNYSHEAEKENNTCVFEVNDCTQQDNNLTIKDEN